MKFIVNFVIVGSLFTSGKARKKLVTKADVIMNIGW